MSHGTNPPTAQQDQPQRTELVLALRRVVSAGPGVPTAGLGPLLDLAAVRYHRDLHPSLEPAVIVEEVLRGVIGAMSDLNEPALDEALTELPTLPDGLRLLFGYSNRTAHLPSADRKRVCWEFLYREPNGTYRYTLKSFLRHTYKWLLGALSSAAIAYDQATAAERARTNHALEILEASERRVADMWRNGYWWLFRLEQHVGHLAYTAQEVHAMFRSGHPLDSPEGVRVIGGMLFDCAGLSRTMRQFQTYSMATLAGHLSMDRMEEPLAWFEGDAAAMFTLNRRDQERVDVELDHRTDVWQTGSWLSYDDAGRLAIKRFEDVLLACPCRQHTPFRIDPACHLLQLGYFAKVFRDAINAAWLASCDSDTLSGPNGDQELYLGRFPPGL